MQERCISRPKHGIIVSGERSTSLMSLHHVSFAFLVALTGTLVSGCTLSREPDTQTADRTGETGWKSRKPDLQPKTKTFALVKSPFYRKALFPAITRLLYQDCSFFRFTSCMEMRDLNERIKGDRTQLIQRNYLTARKRSISE